MIDLAQHIQQKGANAAWLYECLQGKTRHFPYALAGAAHENEEGLLEAVDPSEKRKHGEVLLDTLCYPRDQSQKEPRPLTARASCFVVNIPEGRYPSTTPSNARYAEMMHKIAHEGFTSKRLASSRVSAVVGTNQMESLDPAINRAFTESIENTPASDEISSRRMGFLWRPKYQCSLDSEDLYSAKEAFFLVKLLDKDIAESLREEVEKSEHICKQVPFQQIRETVLRNPLTKERVEVFQNLNASSPVYLTVMDADFLKLNQMFSRSAEAVDVNHPLSVIGSAYTVKGTELPLIRLAVKVDGKVRVAMSGEVPYAAYLPEPFLCILARRANQPHFLASLSFKGPSVALESRRIVQNGLKAGVLDQRMEMLSEGVETSTAARWKTEKNKRYPALSQRQVKAKFTLESIRGLSQSHAHPKKWADQLYTALDFSCAQVTDATTPMMYIFKAYDPISRMIDSEGRFSTKTFNREMQDYNQPLSPERMAVVREKRRLLRNVGMRARVIDQVEAAAKASGQAIYDVLSVETA